MKTKANRKQHAIKVKAAVKAGFITFNSNRRGMKVRTAIKAGRIALNRNRRLHAL